MEPNTKETKNIFERLQRARVALQELKLPKTGKNEYAKFKYYELSDFLPSVNQILLDEGLTSSFNLNEDRAELTLINTYNSDERMVFSSPLPEKYEQKGSTPIQQLGGLHTYLKRYLYMNALEIVENDSIDCQNPNKPESKKEEYEDSIPEYVKVDPPSKSNPIVQTVKPPMEKDKVYQYLNRFLNQSEKDSKKAYGWMKGIIDNPGLKNEDKTQLLLAIDVVYNTKYCQEFKESINNVV